MAIDVPFGWPSAFSSALNRHAQGKPWPTSVRDNGALDTALFRATDQAVATRTGKAPLSVSTNLLGVTAIRAVEFLRRFHSEVDRSGVTGRFCEVYPRAALHEWRLLPTDSYKAKGEKSLAARRTVANRLAEALPWVPIDKVALSDHLLDAFVCALMARAVAKGEAEGPPASRLADARIEGWIWLPKPESLTRLQ